MWASLFPPLRLEEIDRIVLFGDTSNHVELRRYFQHGHFIPIVGMGKERRILIGQW